MSIVYKPIGGSRVDLVVAAAVKIAAIADESVELTFNDTTVTIHPTYERHILEEWSAIRESAQSNIVVPFPPGYGLKPGAEQ